MWKNMARRLETENYFTAVEQETIAYYRGLLVAEQAYVGNRPFLSKEAKIVLMIEGLDPYKEETVGELGSVWGFYNVRKIEPGEDSDPVARQLGIQSVVVNNQELLPGQKFEIYTKALLLCFPNEISGEESV